MSASTAERRPFTEEHLFDTLAEVPPARSISCVYCGGAHPTADEVRACWQRNEAAGGTGSASGAGAAALPFDDVPPPDIEFDPSWGEPEPTPMPTRRVAAPTSGSATRGGARATGSAGRAAGAAGPVARAAAPFVAAPVRRGPRELGRHVVVRVGQAVPPEWTDAPRVVVSAIDADSVGGDAVLSELRGYAAGRQGCVIELAVEPGLLDRAAAETTEAAPHELGPRFTFAGAELAHLVRANAVDLTGDEPRWEAYSQAIALGASAVADGRGDVALPDGTRVWLDGGPVRITPPVDGLAVVHRVTVEHGSLATPRGNETAADLAPDQLAAVTHEGGAARIIAPAGSGKTRVLTERARHLVQQWRVPASAVCLVAFNKRAQEEMQARTIDVPGLQVRTLNAMALAIVNGSAPFARRPQRVATIDEPEVRRLIGRLVNFPRKRNADPVAAWIEALSLARLGLRSPADVESLYDGDVEGFEIVLPRYREQLARAGQVDYDEQVQRAIEILLTDADARAAAQRACRVLLVDEFQDLTPAHLLLVRLLAGPDGAVFGVGDDDQTIYGYNGADPSWLIDFAELFPGAGEHPLEVNYRCPAGVVRAADTLLRHNWRRVAKTIRAAHTEHDGFLVAPAGGDSVATTVTAVRTAIEAGSAPSDVAVLTRVNSLLAPVQVALGAEGIATSGGVGVEFMDRTAVRAGLAWVRLAVSGEDRLSPADLGEALRRPSRSLHPRVAEWVGEQRSFAGLRRLADRVTNERDAATVRGFVDDVERLQRMATTRGTTGQLLATVRDEFGLSSSIAGLDAHRRGMNRAAQNDDLTALAQLADLHDDPATFESWLRGALTRKWDSSGVTLATVHRVKGQEWPFVVVHHAAADQFPHRLAEDEEEERRLFHVAITRAARDVLVVPGPRPSPFIVECTSEPPARAERRPGAGGRGAVGGGGRGVVGSTASEPRAARAQGSTTSPGDGLSPESTALFAALKDWRRHVAAGKPAYTVFADRVLHDIAERRPASIDQLASIKGVGPAKLQQYGAALLDLVAGVVPADD